MYIKNSELKKEKEDRILFRFKRNPKIGEILTSHYYSVTPGPGDYFKEKTPQKNKSKIEDSKYYS